MSTPPPETHPYSSYDRTEIRLTVGEAAYRAIVATAIEHKLDVDELFRTVLSLGGATDEPPTERPSPVTDPIDPETIARKVARTTVAALHDQQTAPDKTRRPRHLNWRRFGAAITVFALGTLLATPSIDAAFDNNDDPGLQGSFLGSAAGQARQEAAATRGNSPEGNLESATDADQMMTSLVDKYPGVAHLPGSIYSAANCISEGYDYQTSGSVLDRGSATAVLLATSLYHQANPYQDDTERTALLGLPQQDIDQQLQTRDLPPSTAEPLRIQYPDISDSELQRLQTSLEATIGHERITAAIAESLRNISDQGDTTRQAFIDQTAEQMSIVYGDHHDPEAGLKIAQILEALMLSDSDTLSTYSEATDPASHPPPLCPPSGNAN
jgi:hypothetical protein